MRCLSPNAKAILMMVGAIFCLSAMDAAAKELNNHVGIIPMVWARYAGQGLELLIFVAPRLRQVVKTNFRVSQASRSLHLMIGPSCFSPALHVSIWPRRRRL